MPLAGRRLSPADAAQGARRRSARWTRVFRFGDGVEPFVEGRGALRPGQTVEIVTPGVGDYGPPAARYPAAVERDLADHRVEV